MPKSKPTNRCHNALSGSSPPAPRPPNGREHNLRSIGAWTTETSQLRQTASSTSDNINNTPPMLQAFLDEHPKESSWSHVTAQAK